MFKVMLTILIIWIVILTTVTIVFAVSETTLPVGNHYFTADWCPACQEQDKIIEELQEQGYTIEIYKGPKIFDELDIRTIPLIIIVKINEKGKQLILKLKGKQPIKKLIKILVKERSNARAL